MAHAVKLSESFELVYNAPKTKDAMSDQRSGKKHSVKPSSTTTSSTTSSYKKPLGKAKRDDICPSLPCPFGTCKSRGLRHWIKDCQNLSNKEESRLRAELAANNAARISRIHYRSSTNNNASIGTTPFVQGLLSGGGFSPRALHYNNFD